MDEAKQPQQEIEKDLQSEEKKEQKIAEPLFTGWNTIFALFIAFTVISILYGVVELILIKTRKPIASTIPYTLADTATNISQTTVTQPPSANQPTIIPSNAGGNSPTPTMSQSKISQSPIPTACGANALKVNVFWHAATGTVLGEIYATNTSASVCSLTGNPTLQIKDSSGIQYQTSIANYTNIYDKTNSNQPTPVILHPNTTVAQVSFSWQGCVPQPTGTIQLFVTVPNATLPLQATSVDQNNKLVSSQLTPACPTGVTPSNQSSLSIGSFVPSLAQQ